MTSEVQTVKTHTEDVIIVNPPPDIRLIVDKTALFIAKNGELFEQNNPLFAFIRPTSSLFSFFTNLVDAYQRIIVPPDGTQEVLARDTGDHSAILSRCLKRLEFDNALDRERLEAAQEAHKDKIEMQSIDWYNFTVVETIDFFDDEDEELPMPITINDVILASKGQPDRNSVVHEDHAMTIPSTETGIKATGESDPNHAVYVTPEKIEELKLKRITSVVLCLLLVHNMSALRLQARWYLRAILQST